MPILAANRARYPANWPQVSVSRKEIAGWRCEWPGCCARQYAVGHWDLRDGVWVWLPMRGSAALEAAGEGLRWPSLERWTCSEARDFAASAYPGEGRPAIVIVLTVGHLDHQPENCDPSNLRAWCQRHHLAYDAKHHRETAFWTRRNRVGNLELFKP